MSLPAVRVSQTPEDKFREYLATRNPPQRLTTQQLELVRHIFKQHRHFDTEALIDDLKANQLKISRATVYRTLTKLVDAGLLLRVEVNNRTFYDHDYGYPQHEHLFCEQCEKMIEFQHPAIDAIIREVASRHGFQVKEHRLVIQGVCQECKQARMSRRRLDLI